MYSMKRGAVHKYINMFNSYSTVHRNKNMYSMKRGAVHKYKFEATMSGYFLRYSIRVLPNVYKTVNLRIEFFYLQQSKNSLDYLYFQGNIYVHQIYEAFFFINMYNSYI